VQHENENENHYGTIQFMQHENETDMGLYIIVNMHAT
jgi:hypothetical protein